jgi:hypothetical protein
MGNQQMAQMAASPIEPSIEEFSKQEQVIALSEGELMVITGGRWTLPVFGFLLNE